MDEQTTTGGCDGRLDVIRYLMAILSLVVTHIYREMDRTGLCGWLSLDEAPKHGRGTKEYGSELRLKRVQLMTKLKVTGYGAAQQNLMLS